MFKHLLTEGDKIVLSFGSSLHDQGVYAMSQVFLNRFPWHGRCISFCTRVNKSLHCAALSVLHAVRTRRSERHAGRTRSVFRLEALSLVNDLGGKLKASTTSPRQGKYRGAVESVVAGDQMPERAAP